MANHNWAPQSPDLSGYAPQSPDLSAYSAPPPPQQQQQHLQPPTSAASWAPQSPDISGFGAYDQQPQHQPPPFQLENPWDQNQSGFNHPYQSPQHPVLPQYSHHQLFDTQQGFDGQQGLDGMPATRSQRVKEEDGDYTPQVSPVKQRGKSVKSEAAAGTGGFTGSNQRPKLDLNGIEVKTKFPTARIKRIMQADEDVGKVAQVTPVVMAKALELFMIRLITASASVAKSRGSKRVQMQHMKAAVMQDEQFDNLKEIVDKVPDAPKKGEADEDEDENGEGHSKKRKKSTAGPKAKKRRESDDDF